MAPDGSLLEQSIPRKIALKHAALFYTQAVCSQNSPIEPTSVSRPVAKHVIMTHEDLIMAYRRGREHEWDSLTIKQYDNWFKGQREFFGSTGNVRDVTVQTAE